MGIKTVSWPYRAICLVLILVFVGYETQTVIKYGFKEFKSVPYLLARMGGAGLNLCTMLSLLSMLRVWMYYLRGIPKIGHVLGLEGYEDLHVAIGYWTVAFFLLHVCGHGLNLYLYYPSPWSAFKDAPIWTGAAATVCLLLIVLTSLLRGEEKFNFPWYSLFKLFHRGWVVVYVAFLCFHGPLIPYLITPIMVAMVAEQALTLITSSRYHNVHVANVDCRDADYALTNESRFVCLTFSTNVLLRSRLCLSQSYHAGEYLLLSDSSWLATWHPISIASSPYDVADQEWNYVNSTVTLYVEVKGRFTKMLQNYRDSHVRLRIAGPFKSAVRSEEAYLTQFSALIFAGPNVGITPMLSLFNYCRYLELKARKKNKTCDRYVGLAHFCTYSWEPINQLGEIVADETANGLTNCRIYCKVSTGATGAVHAHHTNLKIEGRVSDEDCLAAIVGPEAAARLDTDPSRKTALFYCGRPLQYDILARALDGYSDIAFHQEHFAALPMFSDERARICTRKGCAHKWNGCLERLKLTV